MKKSTMLLILIFVFISSLGAIPNPKTKIDLNFSEEIFKEYPVEKENKLFFHPPDCASYFTRNENVLLWLIFFPEELELAYKPDFGWNISEKAIKFQSGMNINKEFADGYWVYFIKIDLEAIPADEFFVFFKYPSWNLGRDETIKFKLTR